MRQRVLSLTQQVSVLKSAKESLTKSLSEQAFSNEKLQNDLNQFQQRAKISKQTIEVMGKSLLNLFASIFTDLFLLVESERFFVLFKRLTKDLEDSQRENQTLIKSSKEYKIPSYPTDKHLEDRLKVSYVALINIVWVHIQKRANCGKSAASLLPRLQSSSRYQDAFTSLASV